MRGYNRALPVSQGFPLLEQCGVGHKVHKACYDLVAERQGGPKLRYFSRLAKKGLRLKAHALSSIHSSVSAAFKRRRCYDSEHHAFDYFAEN